MHSKTIVLELINSISDSGISFSMQEIESTVFTCEEKLDLARALLGVARSRDCISYDLYRDLMSVVLLISSPSIGELWKNKCLYRAKMACRNKGFFGASYNQRISNMMSVLVWFRGEYFKSK